MPRVTVKTRSSIQRRRVSAEIEKALENSERVLVVYGEGAANIYYEGQGSSSQVKGDAGSSH